MSDQRTRLGADGTIDEDVLVPFLQRQRWYGAQTRDAQGAEVVDTVPLCDDGTLRVSLVNLTFDTGMHDLYQLLVRERDGAVFEATGDPVLATRLVELAAGHATVDGVDGRISF